tara:strand:- start:535 stop:747 length:213 start_codon:yes stop_codon:yes gene_type:complete
MYMVAVVTVMDLITLMVTMRQDLPTWVDLNHHHTTSKTILTDTNPTQRGVQAVTDLEVETVAQEVERVSL